MQKSTIGIKFKQNDMRCIDCDNDTFIPVSTDSRYVGTFVFKCNKCNHCFSFSMNHMDNLIVERMSINKFNNIINKPFYTECEKTINSDMLAILISDYVQKTLNYKFKKINDTLIKLRKLHFFTIDNSHDDFINTLNDNLTSSIYKPKTTSTKHLK